MKRALVIGAAAVGVVTALGGGIVLGQHLMSSSTRLAAIGAAGPSAAGQGANQDGGVSWVSALVGRDGTTITVYAGPDPDACMELSQPEATIIEEDDTQVIIAVRAGVVPSDDCDTSLWVDDLNVSTQIPVGERVLRDATSGEPRPTYRERDLPRLPPHRWSPHPSSWSADYEAWNQGYNGPNGWAIRITGQAKMVPDADPVAAIDLGPYPGSITGSPDTDWTLWWDVADATYTLRLQPSEGGTVTLAQFKQELSRLTWS